MNNKSPKNPLYLELYLELRKKIDDGAYPVGARLPSEKELAEEYNVSRITSKRALDQLAADGLIGRFPGKGSYVQASGKPTGVPVAVGKYDAASPKLIGVVMEGTYSPWESDVLIGIESACFDAGYSVIIKYSYGNEERERICINQLLDAGADGLLLMCMHSRIYNSQVMKLAIDGFPVVFFDRALNGLPVPYVGTDHFSAALELTNEMINIGHSHLALVAAEDYHTISSEVDRVNGFVQCCMDSDKTLGMYKRLLLKREDLRQPDPELRRENIRRIRSFFDMYPDITAIMAVNVEIAANVMAALEDHSDRRLFVATFDGQLNTLIRSGESIYVLQDLIAIGDTACKRLLGRINGEDAPMSTVVPYKVVRSGM